jgi:hypothetical protein
MSRSSARKRGRRRSRQIGMGPWIIGAAIALIVLLLGIGLWQSGALASAPAPSHDWDQEELPPLAQEGRPLTGGHDMSLIPQQTPAPRPVVEGAPTPRLVLRSASHDFGRIYSNWDVQHVFGIENQGDADLLINNLVTSCGCTTATLTSSLIGPGERADLAVTFDADLHPTQGQVSRLVWFATNDPRQPWVEVRVDAYVQ